MSEPQILTNADVTHILQRTIDAGAKGVMSHLAKGKWHICEVVFKTLTPYTVHVEAKRQKKLIPMDMAINQPVGISIQHEFKKYIFETVVVGFESSVNESCGGKIVLELPDQIECMQRRAYSRANVPANLNVKVLFWHRGYMDDRKEAPPDNYWQGRMVDLSAGGLQIAVDVEQGPNFRAGQLVGLQFTPMSHQKPILLEAQVKHLAEKAEGKQLYVGVELLGLEVSGEGRQKLRRIIDIVGEYEKQNAAPRQVDEF
jgi:c-di-GMP-binding flagellar brake protein YcgR